MNRFEISEEALSDMREIWNYISENSFDAADRIFDEFYAAFASLARMPGLGHRR